MAFALRQAAGNTVEAGQSVSCSASFGSASLPNSLLFLVAAVTHPRENNSALPSTPSGYTRVFVRKEDKVTVSVWQRTAAPATTKITVNSSGETYGLQIRLLEFTGAAQTNALDRVAIGGNNPETGPGTVNVSTGSTGTLSQSDELLVGVVVNRYASTTQSGFTGGLGRISEHLSEGSEPDHDRTRLTVHVASTSSTSAVTLGARLSSNRDWVAALVSFRGGSLGPARMSSKTQAPAVKITGRANLTVFGPLRSRTQSPAIVIGGRGWIGPFNYQYLLGGRDGLLIGDDTEFRVESHTGLEGWQMRTSDKELSRNDGSLRGTDLQSARQIVFDLKVGGTKLHVEQQMRRLLNALRPQRDEDWELIWRHPGWELRTLWCRPVDIVRELSWEQTTINNQRFALLAADPRIYSLRTRQVQIPVTPAGPDTVVTAASVVNAGNSNAYPVIRITGAPGVTVTNIQLINASVDSRFEVSTVLEPGAELMGDMPARITSAPRSVVTVDGQSRYGAWQYPREAFYLAADPVTPAGVNAVYLRTVPAGAPVTCVLEYRDTWAG